VDILTQVACCFFTQGRTSKAIAGKTKAYPGASKLPVAMFRSGTLAALLSPLALVMSPSAGLAAAPQPPAGVPPVSVERIQEQLNKNAAATLRDMSLQPPVATFRSGIEQRVFVLTFEEQLRKDFTLNLLQRQSADWGSRCCGLSLSQLFNSVEKALDRRKVRKIRQQIARELAELEAVRKK
jgi:hypothetical protein